MYLIKISPHEILPTDGAKIRRNNNNNNKNNNNIVLKTYYFRTCISIQYILFIFYTLVATSMVNCMTSQYWMCVCVCVCVCDEWSPYDVAIAYYSP